MIISGKLPLFVRFPIENKPTKFEIKWYCIYIDTTKKTVDERKMIAYAVMK